MERYSEARHQDNQSLTHLELGSGRLDPERLGLRQRIYRCDRIVTLDIQPSARPDVVADCHHLPFKECVFDSVRADSLLEHVFEPVKVIQEAYRVMVRNGLVFISTPFIWNEHHYPTDQFRFTRLCMRRLLVDAGFNETFIDTTPFTGLFQTLTTIVTFARAREGVLRTPLDLLLYVIVRFSSFARFLDKWIEGDSLYTFVLALGVKPGKDENLRTAKALGRLLMVYSRRPDLAAAFPEVWRGDYVKLVGWAESVVSSRVPDSSREELLEYGKDYSDLAVSEAKPENDAG
jgi:SAM-dependent methyltransferase